MIILVSGHLRVYPVVYTPSSLRLVFEKGMFPKSPLVLFLLIRNKDHGSFGISGIRLEQKIEDLPEGAGKGSLLKGESLIQLFPLLFLGLGHPARPAEGAVVHLQDKEGLGGYGDG